VKKSGDEEERGREGGRASRGKGGGGRKNEPAVAEYPFLSFDCTTYLKGMGVVN
jgi:hypothetical protein